MGIEYPKIELGKAKEKLVKVRDKAKVEFKKAKQKLKERQQTFTLEHCIKKYGEEEGKKRFEARQVKWQKSLKERFKTEGTNNIPQSIFANNIISILKDKFKRAFK